MIYVVGGGGANLNFKVVGSTTQPTSPKENTIWVNTGTKISEWVFSADQPVNPTDGMVWVSTGTSSGAEFNALKKNGIQVYPITARQYVSGEWVDKTAKSYQNGEWVDWWDGEIYSPGDLHEDITGGWEVHNGTRETVVIDGTGINFERDTSGQSGLIASVNTKNKINVGSYKTITIHAVKESASGYVQIGLTDTPDKDPTCIASKKVTDPVSGTIELDISAIVGEYHVAVTGSTTNITVTRVVIR